MFFIWQDDSPDAAEDQLDSLFCVLARVPQTHGLRDVDEQLWHMLGIVLLHAATGAVAPDCWQHVKFFILSSVGLPLLLVLMLFRSFCKTIFLLAMSILLDVSISSHSIRPRTDGPQSMHGASAARELCQAFLSVSRA